jgi:ankyrin repeat protein
MSNQDIIDDPSILIQLSNEAKLQLQLYNSQMRTHEMELLNQIEKLEHRIEKQQMEIDFMKRLLHQQQQLIDPTKTVEIDIEQDDIESQFDQQDDYLNPFHPEFYSDLESFCDSALKEHTTLNDDPSAKLLKFIVNKAIEEKECETKRIQTIVNISKMLPQQIQFVKEEIELLSSVVLSSKQSLQQSLQQTNKLSRLQLQQYCQSFIKPAPLHDDPIITQFQPVSGQLQLNEANIKRIDPQSGETILHNYCRHINTTPLPIFRYLIETKGCDINKRDRTHNTPIHIAFRYFNPNEGADIDILTYLLNLKDIDVNIKDNMGRTILHSACENINGLSLDIFKYVIETKGLKIDCLDRRGNTPLHLLIEDLSDKLDSKISQIAEYLIQKGVSINQKNRSQLTALDKLSQHNSTHPLTYEVLIKNGAKLGKDC